MLTLSALRTIFRFFRTSEREACGVRISLWRRPAFTTAHSLHSGFFFAPRGRIR